MPIEVRELIVRATVGEAKTDQATSPSRNGSKQAVKTAQKLFDQWTDSLKRQQER